MQDSRSVTVHPAHNILGSVAMPGDKSISHRYAMLAAVAAGRSRFQNFSPGADCASTLGCVRALGCNAERDEQGAVTIDGLGPQLRAPDAPLDCGNSGSTMRRLSGIVAGLLAEGHTTVTEPMRTRDHGELALRAFGAKVDRLRNTVTIEGGQTLHPLEAYIPGDISSAAFFLCAAAVFPESNLVIDGVLLNPTRSALLDVLAAMGSRISMVRVEEQHGELLGTITLVPGVAKPVTIAGAQTALLIDELPVLAAIAPYTAGLEVRDAGELRVKESDRLSAVTQILRAMGAQVEQTEDGWRIPGAQRLHGAEIESVGDHRIAMAFAVAALRAQGESLIRNSECVAISYPSFFADLERLLER